MEPRAPAEQPQVLGVVWYPLQDVEELMFGKAVLPDLLTRYYAGIVAQHLLCRERRVSERHIRLGHDIREARAVVNAVIIGVDKDH